MRATLSNASARARSVRTRVRIRRHQLPRRSQSRAAGRGHPPRRPAARAGRRGDRQDDDAGGARRVAHRPGRRARARAAADLHAPRRARDARARALYLGRSPHGRHAGRVVGGTFHSVAHRFVRRHAAVLGLPAGFGVLDAGDAADLLDLVRQEAGVGQTGRRFPRKSTLLDVYSRTVNAQRPLRELLAEAFPWCERHADDLARLFVDYGARKRGLGVIDLDDLLLYWRALAQDAVVGAQLSAGDRPPARRRVPGRQRAPGRPRPRPAQRAPRRHRRGRRPAGRLRLPLGLAGAHPRLPRALPRRGGGHAGAQLPRDASRCSTSPTPWRRRPSAPTARPCSAERPGGRAPELVLCLDEAAQATEVCERVLDARERGAALREQAVLMRASHDSRPARARARPPRHPVRQVRRAALPRGRARQGLPGPPAPGRQPGRPPRWFRWLQLLEGVGPATAGRVLEALEPDAGGLLDVLARWPARAGALPREARGPADAVVAALGAAADDAGGRRARRGPARRAGAARRGALPRRRRPPARPRRAGGGRRPVARPRPLRRRPRPRSARLERGPGRARAASTRTGSCSAPCTRRRASSGARSTCSRSTTATSPPTWRRATARGSRRSAACSTSRSRAPSATCTSTCRCATTTARAARRRPRLRQGVALPHRGGPVAVPAHRPHRASTSTSTGEVIAARAGPRIEVSVDALFR